MRKSTLVLAGISLLSSCQKPAQSVDYYLQHEAERDAMLNRCKTLPQDAERDDDCVNARRAALPAAIGKADVGTVKFPNRPAP